MSVARKVHVIYDIPTLEAAAKSLGFKTTRNGNVRGYAGASMERNADLVISSGDVYDIGFKQTKDGVELVADFHGGYAEKKLEQILPAYFEAKMRGSFKVKRKETTKDSIHLYISK